MGQLVTLEDVDVDRGGIPVLRGVNLAVEETETVGVAGPNGSGKTTLLRLIATLLNPASGEGRVLGARLGTSEIYGTRDQIGMISHVPAVIPELSQRENLIHFTRLSGTGEASIEKVLRVVGLDEAANRRAEASSFGMLRRLEAARLLLTRPKVLLLDEALSGLDAEARELIGALISRTRESGGAVVMVSHDGGQLSAHADRVLMLQGGTLESNS